jgi:hypothetical protein
MPSGSRSCDLPQYRRSSLSAGIVGRDDLAVVLARARAAHRSPLAEPDAVPRAPPSGH